MLNGIYYRAFSSDVTFTLMSNKLYIYIYNVCLWNDLVIYMIIKNYIYILKCTFPVILLIVTYLFGDHFHHCTPGKTLSSQRAARGHLLHGSVVDFDHETWGTWPRKLGTLSHRKVDFVEVNQQNGGILPPDIGT